MDTLQASIDECHAHIKRRKQSKNGRKNPDGTAPMNEMVQSLVQKVLGRQVELESVSEQYLSNHINTDTAGMWEHKNSLKK
jgi:hypothetical protein